MFALSRRRSFPPPLLVCLPCSLVDRRQRDSRASRRNRRRDLLLQRSCAHEQDRGRLVHTLQRPTYNVTHCRNVSCRGNLCGRVEVDVFVGGAGVDVGNIAVEADQVARVVKGEGDAVRLSGSECHHVVRACVGKTGVLAIVGSAASACKYDERWLWTTGVAGHGRGGG